MINNLVAHNSAGDIHSLILMKVNKKNQMTNWLKKQKMQGTIIMWLQLTRNAQISKGNVQVDFCPSQL